ncbi:MAG: hypothetical protein AAFX76_12550, partial [Planctomycetota bacterium]
MNFNQSAKMSLLTNPATRLLNLLEAIESLGQNLNGGPGTRSWAKIFSIDSTDIREMRRRLVVVVVEVTKTGPPESLVWSHSKGPE